MYRNFSYHSD